MKILDVIKEHKLIAVITGVLIFILGPIGLNYLCWIQGWNAEMSVGYYGTMLGAIATITALLVTIDYSLKQSQESFVQMQRKDYENRIYALCDELIDLCSPDYPAEIIGTEEKGEFSFMLYRKERALTLYIIKIQQTYKKFLRFGVDENFLKNNSISNYVDSFCIYINEIITVQKGGESPTSDFSKAIFEEYEKFIKNIGEIPDAIMKKTFPDIRE